jgi:hypothetical protein
VGTLAPALMNHLMLRTLVIALLLAGCSSPATPQPPIAPNARAAEGVAPAPCDHVTAPERLVIDAGSWLTSATGLSVRYEGSSHDSFEGGGFDLSLSLVLWTEDEQSQTWVPSAFAPPRYETFLGHCVRVAEGTEGRVVLEVAPLARPAALRPCAGEPSAPRLTDYALAADGQRYSVEVTRHATTGEWQPAPLPRMPHHHASRLSLRGLSDHPELVGAQRPRLTIELLSHTVEQVPGRHEWRAEYVARVIEACAP